MILDTCALLWLASASKKISKGTLKKIEQETVVYVSAITGFEIALKYHAGKLTLPCPPEEWIKTVVAHHDLTIMPLNMEICVASTELPPHHRDPCDRFIIATATVLSCSVITRDEHFEAYGITTFC